MAFNDYTKPQEIRDYLMKVLSRTGSAKKESLCLYHYSNIKSLQSILKSGYLWLGSADWMNDYLEGELIRSSEKIRTFFFSCFSKTEENLAMYKMYAPNPNGAMLAIPFSVASDIVSSLSGEKKQVYIVRDGKLTDELIEADLYWSAVCYKDLHSDGLRSESVYNENIEDPFNAEELIGFVKLYGWEYEREVRLCAKLERKLNSNERVAVKLPNGFSHKVSIVLGPGFDKTKNRSSLVAVKRIGVKTQASEYDDFVDLGELNKNIESADELKERIKELEVENDKLKVLLNKTIKDVNENTEAEARIQKLKEENQGLQNKLVDLQHEYGVLQSKSGAQGNNKEQHIKDFIPITIYASLMLAFSALDNGQIIVSTSLGGFTFQSGNRNCNRSNEPREIALWKEAVNQLVSNGYIEMEQNSRGVQLYTVTAKGYELNDNFIADNNLVIEGKSVDELLAMLE